VVRSGGLKWLLMAALVLSLGLARPVTADEESDPPLPEVTKTELVPLPAPGDLIRTFGPGEELTYAVKFGPVRAGTAQLKVVGIEWANGARCYRLRSTVKTSAFFASFFPVNDLTESWLDVDKMVSRRFVRMIEEGKYRKREAVQIDVARHLGYYYPKRDTVEVAAGAQDVLSILYFARGLDLDVGQGVIIPSHVDKKNAAVELRVLKREQVTVPAGTFTCGVVEPLLKTAGLFKQEGRLTLWVSDDEKRIPVIMKSKVKVGSITAVLESYKPGRVDTASGIATH
jgi:hypothetical protein